MRHYAISLSLFSLLIQISCEDKFQFNDPLLGEWRLSEITLKTSKGIQSIRGEEQYIIFEEDKTYESNDFRTLDENLPATGKWEIIDEVTFSVWLNSKTIIFNDDTVFDYKIETIDFKDYLFFYRNNEISDQFNFIELIYHKKDLNT
jgi:hypothetical protein